jgi:hypothetical protein
VVHARTEWRHSQSCLGSRRGGRRNATVSMQIQAREFGDHIGVPVEGQLGTVVEPASLERYFESRFMCDTVPMSYHETLWLAISASAPVIALASIVSIGDSYKLDEMSQRSGQVGREIGVWPVFINAANMALQIGALLGALLSLYNGRDSGHGLIFVVLTQPLGIALLSIATLMNGAERLKAKKLRSNTENPKREDKE